VALREALAGKEADPIKQKMEDLQKVLEEIGTAAYQNVAQQQQQQTSSNQAQPGPTPDGSKKDAVDVDYKVVDDKK
jgi:hypothetical protein